MNTIRKKYPIINCTHLASYIIAKKGPMSQLKVQKLLYYIEAWHLVFFNHSIIKDDFEAWVHGPVCRPVWHAIKDHSKLYDLVTVKDRQRCIERVKNTLLKEQLELIGDVLKEYGNKTDYYLECLTHDEYPWIEARRGLKKDDIGKNAISKKTMKRFYENMLDK